MNARPPRKAASPTRGLPRAQAGRTLIELLVAVALGLLVAGAAVAALLIARQGFTSVDSGAQLRENSRFAANLIQRIVVQAGYEPNDTGLFTDPKNPGLRGYDNAVITVPADGSMPVFAQDSRDAGCGAVTDTSCVNGSDVLVVRFYGVSRGGAADGSMIDCAGKSEPEGAEQSYSVFHVAVGSSGEPTLACAYVDPADGKWKDTALVSGVEGFQVLYGFDDDGDSVADRYRRAKDLDAGSETATLDNWRKVRTIRVGLLIRGAQGSAVDRAATAASQAVLGSIFSSASDTGSQLVPSADGRLRQSYVFTVHLRNPQDKAL